MKNLLIAIAMLTGVQFTTSFQQHKAENQNYECKYGQCIATKKNGEACQNCAQKDSYYCWSHNHQ